MPNNQDRFESLIRRVRLARGLEAGGYYNAAKVAWSTVFSLMTQSSNEMGGPLAAEDLPGAMETLIEELDAAGQLAPAGALRKGFLAVREDRIIPFREIPRVVVCRKCGLIQVDEERQTCPECGADPLTLREFIPNYFLEPLSPRQALEALAAGPAELEKRLEDLGDDQLVQPPQPGAWAIRDVLQHILISEKLLAGRIDRILEEDNPDLAGAAVWTMEGDEPLRPRAIFDEYRNLREANVKRLQSIVFEAWWLTGQHEEFGQVTLLQQAGYFAKHERDHFWQIDQIRRAIG